MVSLALTQVSPVPLKPFLLIQCVIRLRIQGEVNDRVFQRQILPLLETLR